MSVKGFVCPARGGCRGLSIFTCKGPGPVSPDGECWSWSSLCHCVLLSVFMQEHGDHWPASLFLIHDLIPYLFCILTSPQI